MTPSRIHKLTLTHFRNYRAASVQARGDVVALVGPNGAGKTNCLEAISFLSPGRGLRRATLEDVADNQGDGSWAVSAEVEGALGLATLGTGIDAPGGEMAATSRRCRIDREPVSSATAFGQPPPLGVPRRAGGGGFSPVWCWRATASIRAGSRRWTAACARATGCSRCVITTTIGVTRSNAKPPNSPWRGPLRGARPRPRPRRS